MIDGFLLRFVVLVFLLPFQHPNQETTRQNTILKILIFKGAEMTYRIPHARWQYERMYAFKTYLFQIPKILRRKEKQKKKTKINIHSHSLWMPLDRQTDRRVWLNCFLMFLVLHIQNRLCVAVILCVVLVVAVVGIVVCGKVV